MVFLLLVLAPLVLARAFQADSLLTTSDATRSSPEALTFALLLVALAEAFEGWNGLLQRVVLAVPLLWIAVLGTRLARAPHGLPFDPREKFESVGEDLRPRRGLRRPGE